MTPTRTPDAPGVAPAAPAPTPPPDDDGVIYLDLNPASVAYLEDVAWTDDEQNAGLFAPYPDEWVAVYRREVRGHGQDPNTLREEVARQHGFDPDKIVVFYVEPPFEC